MFHLSKREIIKSAYKMFSYISKMFWAPWRKDSTYNLSYSIINDYIF